MTKTTDLDPAAIMAARMRAAAPDDTVTTAGALESLRAALADRDRLAAEVAALRERAELHEHASGRCWTEDHAGQLAALREQVQRVEALAADLTWKRPEVCPCSPETVEACCGSESSCDAMTPSTKVVGARTIRAALAGEGAAETPIRLGSCCVKVGTADCHCAEPTNWGAVPQPSARDIIERPTGRVNHA